MTHHPPSSPEPSDPSGERATGLPWPRSWASVYLLVMGCFALYVALLAVLTRVFAP